MGVLIAAFWLAALIGLAVTVAISLLLRWWGLRRLTITALAVPMIAGGLVFVTLYVPLMKWIWSGTVTRGQNVALAEYRALGPSLPPEASNITYYGNYGGTEAVFSLAEDAFMRWAVDNKWQTSVVAAPEQISLHSLEVSASVNQGFVVKELFHPRGTGVHIVFDGKKNLCYFSFSSY